jgi:hypothetical protein
MCRMRLGCSATQLLSPPSWSGLIRRARAGYVRRGRRRSGWPKSLSPRRRRTLRLQRREKSFAARFDC